MSLYSCLCDLMHKYFPSGYKWRYVYFYAINEIFSDLQSASKMFYYVICIDFIIKTLMRRKGSLFGLICLSSRKISSRIFYFLSINNDNLKTTIHFQYNKHFFL